MGHKLLAYPGKDRNMNATLSGRYAYRSFRHDPIVVEDGKVAGEPELATPWSPWSPPGVLEVVTDAAGAVTGTLRFGQQLVLDITGAIIPGSQRQPPSIELIGAAGSSVNKIKGYFIPDSDHIVGTIMALANDPLGEPNGTLGPFVLVPLGE